MFGRSGKKKSDPDAISAFLGVGAEYRGQFNFQGTARIDGSVIGDIFSDGTLILGEDGRVEGHIRVAELIANGRVVGDVEASRRVVLSKCSNVRGNLLSPVVRIEDGAVVNGVVSMTLPDNPVLSPGEVRGALAAGEDGDSVGN